MTGPAGSASRTSAGRSWWRAWRIAVAVVATVAVAAFTFAYRFNSLSGTFGGFDNDHFAHLMRTEMLLQGEQPLRDFADAELRGAWPALSYAVPAWAQMLGGRTLLPEAYLTVGALAVAYAVVFLQALDLSKRWSVAVAAAVVALLTAPKLYNYPKVLMLAWGALVLHLAMVNPSTLRLGLAALSTAVATLFRHDYGVYLAVGMIAGLLVRDVRQAARRIAIYGGLTAVFLLPSALWVQWYEGIPTYVASALATSRLETARTALQWPPLDLSTMFTGDGLLLLTYYAFWAVLVAAAGVLAARVVMPGAPRLAPAERATAVGLLALAAVVNIFFLRANLSQRFGDAVIPVALLAAWSIGAGSMLTARSIRALAMLIPGVLLLSILAAACAFGDVTNHLDTAGMTDSWDTTARRFEAVRTDLLLLPPTAWQPDAAEGTLAAARYLAECTTPNDYVLVAAYAPEIPVFARRRFAGGQATVSLSFYTSDVEQRQTLARLERQSVPIILADAREFEEGFVADYPLLAQHLARDYREAGTIVVDEQPRFRVFVEADRQPRGVDAHFGLPCFR